MHRTASILSVVSLAAAVLVFSVTQLAFPPVGFEGMMAVAGLSVLISLLSGLVALVVCCILLVRKSKPVPVKPLLAAVGALCALAIAVWILRHPSSPNNAINTDSGNQSSFVALISAAGYGGR